MELFASTVIPASPAELQRRLTIADLPNWCASVEKVLSDDTSSGELFTVWGTFRVNREELSIGVRFSLPNCPNAFQWTVTTGHDPDPSHTFIHVSINRTEHDQDFIESIEQFVEDWKTGLETQW